MRFEKLFVLAGIVAMAAAIGSLVGGRVDTGIIWSFTAVLFFAAAYTARGTNRRKKARMDALLEKAKEEE